MHIHQLLKQLNANGRNRAVPTSVLSKLTGLTRRQVVSIINRERKRHLICSKTDSGGGYYRPANIGEIKEFFSVQEQRIKRHAVSIRLPRRLMKRRKK